MNLKQGVWKYVVVIKCRHNPGRFGSVIAHPDLDGEVSGSRPGYTTKV